MEYKKAFAAFMLVFAMTLLTVDKDRDVQGKNMSPSGTSDWVNSPAVQFTPDGDRASHYPPYHHPTQ
ncbi:MAG: hypothetical protein ABFD97_14740 [Syntrophobacter sp.]